MAQALFAKSVSVARTHAANRALAMPAQTALTGSGEATDLCDHAWSARSVDSGFTSTETVPQQDAATATR